MLVVQRFWLALLVTSSLLLGNVYAQAVPFYKTNLPDPTVGFDVSENQTIGVRFSPIDDITLDSIEVWFMNNSPVKQGTVILSLRLDVPLEDGTSKPDDEILEQWTIDVPGGKWEVEQKTVDSVLHPQLSHNERYWLVAESDDKAKNNPVWNMTDNKGNDLTRGYLGSYDKRSQQWTVLGYSGIPAVRVYGHLPENN